MRRYEEDRDPIPPGHGERDVGEVVDVPCCPVCGGAMRRRTEYPGQHKVLVCDLHGVQKPVYERSHD